MAFDLAAMVRRLGSRRYRRIRRLRPIKPRPATVLELQAIFPEIVLPWIAAIDEIVKAYNRSPSVTLDSPSETSRLIQLVATETDRAAIRLTARVRGWAARNEGRHRAQWGEGVLAATGIDVGTLIGPEAAKETIEAVVARNVALIRNIDESTRARFSDIVFRGVNERRPARAVAKQLAEAADIERKRALRIAADQSTKLYAALDQARQEEAGIDHFIWQHSGKLHPRQDHVERNGVLYKWRASPKGPGRNPPDDMPGTLPYCGCTAVAALVDERGKVL